VFQGSFWPDRASVCELIWDCMFTSSAWVYNWSLEMYSLSARSECTCLYLSERSHILHGTYVSGHSK
jgi:hypothetical protein